MRYQDNVFATFDDKVKSGVKVTIAQALSSFNHSELTDSQQKEGLDMMALLDGMILVDMPLSRFGADAAVIQNFRQNFCFRTEECATLTMMNELTRQARVQRVTYGQNSSAGSSQSVTESKDAVLDATLFRQLGPDQVIGLLSVNRHSMDDLFNLMPVYIEN